MHTSKVSRARRRGYSLLGAVLAMTCLAALGWREISTSGTRPVPDVRTLAPALSLRLVDDSLLDNFATAPDFPDALLVPPKLRATASPPSGARTAALSSTPEIRIAQPSSAPGNAGWRVSWSAVPGNTYTLQRSDSLATGNSSASPWINIATVTAQGPVAEAEDPTASTRLSRFYRVTASPSGFRPQLLAPIPLAVGSWRLQWTSVAGKVYRLQRSPGGNPSSAAFQWIDLASLTATGSTSHFDDTGVDSTGHRFYRVIQLDGTIPAGTVVTIPTANPSALTANGVVILATTATDAAGIASVRFFDGIADLGAAVHAEGDQWRLVWPADGLSNGIHPITAQAFNASGVATTSTALSFTVQISSSQQQQPLGRLTLGADRFSTNGTSVVPTGNVRVGLASIESTGTVSIDTGNGLVSGSGGITLPGLGVVFTGPYSLDPATGWLKARSASAAQLADAALASVPPTIALSSQSTLAPRRIEVNVVDGALRGDGVATLVVPGPNAGTLRADGAFEYDPAAFSLAVVGTFQWRAISGTGRVSIRLNDSTFVVTGLMNVPAAGGGNSIALANATLRMTLDVTGLPIASISGQRTTGGVVDSVVGTLDSSGAANLLADTLTPPLIRDDVAHFVALGANGEPMNGIGVQARPDGSLAPFEYRPGGPSLSGAGQQFFIRFPNGARLVPENTVNYLEFVQARAGFGPASPLQFAESVERLSGPSRRLRIGPMDFADLAAAFDRPASDGIATRIFDRLPLTWKGGTLVSDGIRGARFALPSPGMNLPGSSAEWPDLVIDFTRQDGIRIPLSGDFALPDGSDSPGGLSIPANHPMWLGIRADGSVFINGRVQVAFPGNGPKFDANIRFDDPYYDLQIAAIGVQLPVLGSLANGLPSSADACVPGASTPDANQLRQAIECLRHHGLALVNFSANTVDVNSDPGAAPTGGSIPAAFDTLTSALDAASHGTLAGGTAGLSADLRNTLFRQVGQSAVAARDLQTILACRLSLERARKAGLRDGAIAEFDAAASATVTAATRGSSRPTVSTLASLRSVLGSLIDTESILQNLPADSTGATLLGDPLLRTAMTQVLHDFAEKQSQSLGVNSGAFSPALNPAIANLTGSVTREILTQWLDVLTAAKRLGIDTPTGVPAPELTAQLSVHLAALARESLTRAENNHDFRGFLAPLADLVTLAAARRSGPLANLPAQTLASLPGDADAIADATRLDAVLKADPTLSQAHDSLRVTAAQLTALSRILEQLPPNSSIPSLLAVSFRPAFSQVESALAQALATSATANNLTDLLDILEAGLRHARLRDQLGITVTAPWEGADRSGRIVARIAQLGAPAYAWSELHRAGELLLDTASLSTANDGARARAKLLLAQSAQVLATARGVSTALWSAESARRSGVLDSPDIRLPGDLTISRAAGSLRFNQVTHQLLGAFTGQLKLPKFDLTLTVPNASFATGGGLDINAYGSIVLPSADAMIGRLSIPQDHPLHVAFTAPDKLTIEGGAKLEVNGMTFEGSMILDDPEYAFALSAEGIHFDLARSIHVYLPTLPQGEAYDLATARDLNDYYRLVGNTLERARGNSATGADATRAELAGGGTSTFSYPAGTPPEVIKKLESGDTEDPAVAALIVKLSDRLANNEDVTAQMDRLGESLDQLRKHLKSLPPGRINVAQMMVRNEVIERLCEAYKHLKDQPDPAAYERLRDSNKLAEFLQETQDYVLGLLTSDDPSVAAQVVEVAQIAGSFHSALKCFVGLPELSSYLAQVDLFMESYQGFLLRQAGNFFARLGLDRSSGEPLPGWAAINQPSYLLVPAEITRPLPLAEKLRSHSEPVSAALWSRLSDAGRNVIGNPATPEGQLRAAIVSEFNLIIPAATTYEPGRFSAVTLSETNRALIKAGIPSGKLSLFNRFLLSDAFPSEIAGRIDAFDRPALRKYCEIFAQYHMAGQKMDVRDTSDFTGALRTLSVRERELTFRRLVELVPQPQWPSVLTNLVRLRFKLHGKTWGRFEMPPTKELFDHYEELRQIRDELLTLLIRGQLDFDWGPNAVYQPYGEPTAIDIAADYDNATRAWIQASAFANNYDETGHPLNLGGDPRVFLVEPDGKGGLVNIRIDLIHLCGDDADPMYKKSQYLRDKIARDAKLKETQDAAIEASYQFALKNLLEGRSPEAAQPIPPATPNILQRLINALGYAHINPSAAANGGPDAIAVLRDIMSLMDSIVDALPASPSPGPGLASPAGNSPYNPYLSQVIGILLDAAESPELADAPNITLQLRTQATALLRKAAHICAALQLRLPATRPVDLQLPGSVSIDKVFGEIHYRKDTGLLGGNFGGKLSFPDNDASFDVTEASIDNQGKFSFKAAIATPLPLGGIRIKADLAASGRGKPNPNPLLPPIPADQEFSLAGSGTLTLPRSGGRDQEYQCAVSYSTTTKVLSFDTQVRNLDLELGPQVVLFGAGMGFKLGGIGLDGLRPRGGELDFSGSAGFLRKDPAPLPDQVSERNYQLIADQVKTRFTFRTDGFDLAITGGILKLPELFTPGICSTNPPDESTERATIEIRPDNPIQLTFGLAPPQGLTPPSITSVRFSGSLALHDIGISVPQIEGLAGEICSGVLHFPGIEIANQTLSLEQMPRLEIELGKMRIPLPPGQTSRLDIVHVNWALNGFPSGTVRLSEDLTLLDQAGLSLTLLGAANTNCFTEDGHTPLASAITVFPGDAISFPPVLPGFRLDGGIKLALPLSALTTTSSPPDKVTGIACGSLTVRPNTPPDFVLSTLGIGGTFHLGSSGPVIEGAEISVDQLQNIFNLGNGREVIFRVAGTLKIPQGPSFTLDNARLRFFDPQRPPQFALDGMAVNNRDFTLMQRLPVRVQNASFHFANSNLSIEQLFQPANIQFTVSADISIPPAPSDPYFTGRVDDLEIHFSPEGIPLIQGIDGFGLGVGGLKFPPIKELGGRLYLGGLSAVDSTGLPDLNRIFLVGRLGGSYEGYQVIVQGAFTLHGPIGLCLDVNAGAAGIPLGPSGFLFTGASGGISYVNNNGDPCDFKTYFTQDPQGNLTGPSSAGIPLPTMSWEQMTQMVRRMEAQEAVFAQFRPPPLAANSQPALANTSAAPNTSAVPTGDTDWSEPDPFPAEQAVVEAFATEASSTGSSGIPCPGDCPPATVNIFCQPHPDQARFPGKVIMKFSSIDESTLGNIVGITPGSIAALGNDTTRIVTSVAQSIRHQVEQITPPPLSPPLTAQEQQQLRALVNQVFDSLQSALTDLLNQQLRGSAPDQYYGKIRDLVYSGLPCPDETMSVSGTFSYAGISSFASVTGKGILSTAGSVGIIGTLNVIGIPVGEAKVFVAVTDAQGDPNPSLCGRVGFEFGPLSIGEVKLAYECPGCVTGMLKGFGVVALRLADFSPGIFQQIVARVAPDVNVNGLTPDRIIALLSPQQRLGFLAELARAPAGVLPTDLPQVFFSGLSGVWDQINPRETFCGSVQPKLFGLPITPSAVDFSAMATKSQEAGSLSFSPSMLLSYFLPIFPADQATLSYDIRYPDAVKFLLGGMAGRFATPEAAMAYGKESLDYLLQNTAFGVDYTFSPLGMRVATAQARIIIPNLTEHPERYLPADPRHWKTPESLAATQPTLPSRQDLLIAAADSRNLGNAFLWKGTTNDLFTVFPEGSPQRNALINRSLARDYFPHGGVVGAGLLTVPRILTATPPYDDYRKVVNQAANPLDRLGAAAKIISEYVLKTETNGTLAFYLPAPNPPIFFGPSGEPLGQSQLDQISRANSASQILDSIKSFDPSRIQVANLYPIQYAFLRGYVDGQFLGVPIARADVEGVPPSNGGDAYIRVTAGVANNGWVKQFVDQASLNFELRQTPPTNILGRFNALLAEITALTNKAGVTQAELIAKSGEALNSLAADLPKVSLDASLQNFHLPPALTTYLSAPPANVSFKLLAYSPRYAPNTPGDGIAATARREGGIVLTGAFNLAGLVTVNPAELSLTPNGNGVPTLAGHFAGVGFPLPGNITFSNGQLDFNTAPAAGQPFFAAAGAVSPITLGVLGTTLRPLASGATTLGASVQVIQGPAGAPPGTRLSINPARIDFPKVGTGQTIKLYGADATQPFTFSTSGPWTATASFEGGIKLYDSSGLIEVLRIDSTTPLIGSIAGVGVSSAEITVTFPQGIVATAFNGRPVARSITLSASSSPRLILRTDGTFELTGSADGSLPLSGVAFSTLSAGATARLTQSSLTLSGSLTGSTIDGMNPLGASGTVTVTSSSSSFSGTATLGPFVFGAFRLEPDDGSPIFNAVFSDSGMTLKPGVRLACSGLLATGLPGLTFDKSGNFNYHVGPTSLNLGPFALSNVGFNAYHTNGIFTVTNLTGQFSPAGVSPGISLSGYIDSAGGVSLEGSASAGSMNGFQMASMTASLRRGGTSYPALVTSAGPLAYWQFQETKATTAASSTGTAFDASYQGGVTLAQPGAFPGSRGVLFDGKSGFIPAKNPIQFADIKGALTLEAWIRVDKFNLTWNTIIAKGDTTWRLQRNGDLNTLRFDTDGLTPPYLEGNKPVNDGAWHHVVATYDGSHKELWIDGQIDARLAATGSIAGNSLTVCIGNSIDPKGNLMNRYWNGALDDVAVYNRALTPTEITEHYQSGGGLVLRAQLNLGMPNVSTPVLTGFFWPNSAFVLTGGPANSSFGGFGLNNASFYLSKLPGDPLPTFLADGDLAVDGIPAAHLSGSLTPPANADFFATVGNGAILGLNFNDVFVELTGSSSQAKVGVGGNITVTDIGTFGFHGSASTDGTLLLTNNFLNGMNILGYPLNSVSLSLSRPAVSYPALIAGGTSVFSLNDFGDNPVGYWRLGEASGTAATDSKKSNPRTNPAIPGTYVGGILHGKPSPMSSARGGVPSAQFGGNDGYISLGSEGSFDFSSALAVEVWIKKDLINTDWEAIVTKGDSAWRLSTYGNQDRLSFDTSSAKGAHSLPGAHKIADNQWHHVVATYDGHAKCLYVDGILESFAVYSEPILQNNAPVLIGENAEVRGRNFRGYMSEVAIYNHALTPSQVLNHYLASGRGGIIARGSLGIPGITQADVAGMIRPDGQVGLEASLPALQLGNFSLNGATIALLRLAGAGSSVAAGGSLSTPVGNFGLSGNLPADGNYSLTTEAGGSFAIGDRTLTYSTPATLTPNRLQVNGSVVYGDFTFTGAAVIAPNSPPSFSGSTSGDTGFKAFGKAVNGQPGHPYAGFKWTASAGYDAASKSILANCSGTLTVEVEILHIGQPSTYEKYGYNMPSFGLPTDGIISMTPNVLKGQSLKAGTSFGFDLP